MNTYPALRIAPRSSKTIQGGKTSLEKWIDPILISRARSGAVKGRRLQAGKKRALEIAHNGLTATEKATLEAFYDANRAQPFLFALLATNYTVIFGGDELDWDPVEGNLWNVSVTLLEV